MTKDELKLAFQKAFQMGQDYWYHANHEFESYNKKSDAIKEKFNEMVKETIEEALAQSEQESTNWHVIDPTGNVVATEKDAIHGWARLGGFKPTLEVLLAHHESGWRVVPAPPLPVQPDQSVAGYCKKIGELIAERDRLRAALAQPVQPEQEPVAWEQFHEHLVERNFCPRCGKRTADLTTIHTCTPPPREW